MVDLGGAVEGRVYPDDRLAAAAIGAAFVRARPRPFDIKLEPARGGLDKIAYRMG
jgi:hypothetical protein